MVTDVVVVGGGIIGCTAAYFLAKKGKSVTLIEKNSIAGGTTASNFSWINATSKTSDVEYHHLNAAGVRMYASLEEEYGPATLGLGGDGAIGFTRRSDSTSFSMMQNQARKLKKYNYPVEWLDLSALQELEPNVEFADDTEGFLTPSDKILDTSHFTRFMVERVSQMGGKIVENCPAQEIFFDDEGHVKGLLAALGTIDTSNVLLAAGPATPEVLGQLTGYEGFSTHFPIRKVPGLLISTPKLDKDLVKHLLYTDTGGEFHVLPEQGGGLRLASDDVDGKMIDDQSPEHLRELANILLLRMQNIVPDFVGTDCLDNCSITIGVRAYPEDGKSIAGAFPNSRGLYLIATHSGVTLAPVLGNLISELIIEGEIPGLLSPFGLDRLPGYR